MATRGRSVVRRFGIVVFAACLPLAGCRDGLAPELRGARVEIRYAGAKFNEETVAIGATLQLAGLVLDARGNVLPNEKVAWSAGDPSVLAVDESGTVVAQGIGASYVVAHHRVGTDTARINVAQPVSGAVECEPGEVMEMTVGESRRISGPAATRICLAGGDGINAEYVLVTTNSATSAGSILPVQLHGTGITFVFNPPQPATAPVGGPHRPTPDVRFHEELRGGMSARLEPLLRAGVTATDFPPIRPLQSVDDLVSLNVARGTNGCDAVDMRAGRVRAVTDRAIIVADTSNPAGGFASEDYLEFGRFFDEEVWPLVTGTFGIPSDIDGNGRAIIFFTVAVNELAENSNAPENAGSYVGGFFFNRDLFPTSSCTGSNSAEMVYLLVPDSAGQAIAGGRRPFPRQMVKAQIPTLLVHELQHLVNDSRRLHVNAAPIWEQTWLNEGLSHIAEELMFYRQAGLAPGGNISISSLLNNDARNAFRSFQLDNVDRLAHYLSDPETGSPMGPDNLVTRAAAWSFLRYAADRSGAEAALWTDLVRNSRTAGFENLASAIDGDPLEWIRDWAAALYLDDTGLDLEPVHRTTSWNFRSIFPNLSLLGVGRTSRPYPLRAPRLFTDQPRAIQLHGGAAAYARFGVEPNGRGAIRITVGASLPPPDRLSVLVVRTR
jgi:hypothetical protein